MTALDFAWARPSIPQLQAAGVTDVFRYVGPPSWGKTITQDEYDGYVAVGIRVWLVFEDTANDSAGGVDAGGANALIAIYYAPTGYKGPIFFACDESLSGTALATAIAYISGACGVMGGAGHTGVYGEGALVQAVHDAGWADFYWQSDSTSFPGNATTLPITQVQQGLGGPIAGTDVDRIVLPLIAPPPAPAGADFDTDDMESLMTLAASKQDAFNAQIRYWWNTYRTDPMTTDDVNLLWYVYNVPTSGNGWGGSIDAVQAWIVDNAQTTGVLRPAYAGAV